MLQITEGGKQEEKSEKGRNHRETSPAAARLGQDRIPGTRRGGGFGKSSSPPPQASSEHDGPQPRR